MIDVSVIIISYNTKRLLRECLDSVRKFTKGVNYEIIVVDNNSQDGTRIMLSKDRSIKKFYNKENLGFARANNQGMKKALGRYILLLNSDTRLIEDSISKIKDLMDKNSKIGIATCKLLNSDRIIQPTGGYFPTPLRLFFWATFLDDLPIFNLVMGQYHPHTPDSLFGGGYYLKEHEQDWVTGAFFCIRHDVISKVGFLDENFFMYVEELEYCYRVKKAGFRIYYTATTNIIHLGGGSTENSILGEYRGLKLFYQKHFNFLSNVLLKFILEVSAILRFFVFLILKRKEAKIYAKAITII